jgi:hypothetical protein
MKAETKLGDRIKKGCTQAYGGSTKMLLFNFLCSRGKGVQPLMSMRVHNSLLPKAELD